MEYFKVEGGHALLGEITVSGAKNVALKVLIASLLTEEEVIIENVPLISDLYALAEIIKELGGEVEISPNHEMRINAKNLHTFEITSSGFGKLRASFLLLVPLLSRFKQVKIPLSGGDKIGVRPIDRTINGLRKMGAQLDFYDGYYHAKTQGLKPVCYEFSKNTHTGTEALIMAACLTKGKTVLKNAAEEPEVDDLIAFLNSMGADITRRKNRTVEVRGVRKLHGTTFRIMPDRNEVVTFAIAAILTKGKLSIGPLYHEHLDAFYEVLSRVGITFTHKGNHLLIDGDKRPIFASNVETAPYPGFMTDWQAPWTLLMTQAEGVSCVYEKVFDNRFGYVAELKKMGAQILPCEMNLKNPQKELNFNYLAEEKNVIHAVEIVGPSKLVGQELLIPDLRAGATLVLAALTATGVSRLYGIEHIDRGYENFCERLKKLGAKMERINEN